MSVTTKVFVVGGNQAVRLPKEFRFDTSEVFIRRDHLTGDVVLSPRPNSWNGFFALYATTVLPADFMSKEDRAQGESSRDPFAGNAT
jgi:antitoxin VapB